MHLVFLSKTMYDTLALRFVVHRVGRWLHSAEPSEEVLLHRSTFTIFVSYKYRVVGTRRVEQLLEVVGGLTALASVALLLGVAPLTPWRPTPWPTRGGRWGFFSAAVTNNTFLAFLFFSNHGGRMGPRRWGLLPF